MCEPSSILGVVLCTYQASNRLDSYERAEEGTGRRQDSALPVVGLWILFFSLLRAAVSAMC